jgi:hypothetical protein
MNHVCDTLAYVPVVVKRVIFSKDIRLFMTLFAQPIVLSLLVFLAALLVHDVASSILWVVDSGASSHYSFVLSNFIDYESRDELGIVFGINSRSLGIDNIFVSTVIDSNDGPANFTLLNALYVLDLSQRSVGAYLHLLGVRLVADAGFDFTFSANSDSLRHTIGLNYRSRSSLWPYIASVFLS